jgi:hypothetical protein
VGSRRGTDRYEVLGTLGEGGVGVADEVRDRHGGELRVLKTMVGVDADHLLRLKDEFRAAIDLRHGNLVRLGEASAALIEAVARSAFLARRLGAPPNAWRACSVRPSLPVGEPASRLSG